ncbi:hypothetical protein [Candidatus Methylomicrobium oryzae]|uniref:hypothetical protein n=1 Tax=Candidatus Methylomicrobium oryzae TaxID=2802053 RepID=UPI0019244F0B|nr:hypothetical protein [Methylomicrobium sp. RS1]MBL1262694.1 hypothetical protein [Methylomicrobium sp. RS1]
MREAALWLQKFTLMLFIRASILILLMIHLQGCTAMVINMAQHDKVFVPFEENHKGSRLWYAAIPITVPLDLFGVLMCLGALPVCAQMMDVIVKVSEDRAQSKPGNVHNVSQGRQDK